MHKDPRNPLREQLERSRREAHEGMLVMRSHQQTLETALAWLSYEQDRALLQKQQVNT